MPIRTLPNNLEAEESVLGACFLSKYALQKASKIYLLILFIMKKIVKYMLLYYH